MVGRGISHAECGEHRNSRHACPIDCPYNPFAPANYDQLLELEQRVDQQSLARLEEEAADPGALRQEFQRALSSSNPHALHARIVWRLFYEQDAAGRTCAQRWEAAGFPGLRNDGRVLLRGKMRTRVALLESHRVRDGGQVEAVDLLAASPQPLVVQDRGFAAGAVRFGTALTWVYPLPHYHRLFGTALLLQEVPGFEPRQVLEEVAAHLGGPLEEEPLRRWLAGNFLRVEDALTAVGLERRRLTFASLDAQYCSATYRLERPAPECLAVLEALPLIEPEEPADTEKTEGFHDARVWFAPPDGGGPDAVHPPGAQPVLGRVLLGEQRWQITAMGRARFETLRARFEAALGDRVRFLDSRMDDLLHRVTSKEPKADLSLVPPRLIEQPGQLQLSSSRVSASAPGVRPGPPGPAMLEALDRAFLDGPVPALNGLTPRAAATDPAARNALVRLMKDRVRHWDEQNLKDGTDYDCNWTLRELGLTELLFDPPPAGRHPRLVPRTGEPAPEEMPPWPVDPGVGAALPMNPRLPPAPPLPGRPWTDEEALARMQAGARAYAGRAHVVESFGADGCTLLEDVESVTGGQLAPEALALVVPSLIQIWHAFVPPGTRGRNVTRARLRGSIVREVRRVACALPEEGSASWDNLVAGSAQPGLFRVAVLQLAAIYEGLPASRCPSPEDQLTLIVLLRAVIEVLDEVHRDR